MQGTLLHPKGLYLRAQSFFPRSTHHTTIFSTDADLFESANIYSLQLASAYKTFWNKSFSRTSQAKFPKPSSNNSVTGLAIVEDQSSILHMNQEAFKQLKIPNNQLSHQTLKTGTVTSFQKNVVAEEIIKKLFCFLCVWTLKIRKPANRWNNFKGIHRNLENPWKHGQLIKAPWKFFRNFKKTWNCWNTPEKSGNPWNSGKREIADINP